MTPRAYRLKIAACAGLGLAVVAAAAALAAALFPPPADCVVHARNPYRFRDWKHYVDGMSGRGAAACVALISDSQAYAGEERKSRRIYAARLEALLNERKTGGFARWEVLNLSSDGVTTLEYLALAARLRDERPTWLISVSGCADYRGDNFRCGFGYARSDLPGLMTEWRLARRLPWAFWRRHGKVEDTLMAWVAHRFPLLRFRDYLWSWLDTRFPGAQRAFYAPRTTYRFWELPGKPRTAPVPPPLPEKGGGAIDLTYDWRSTILLREFLDQFAAVPADHRLVVAAPLRTGFGDSPKGAWIDAFRGDLQRLSAARGLPFWDLTEALPPEDFITSSHLQDGNHKRLAELLADRIAAEMEK